MPDTLTTGGPNAVIADEGMMYWRTPDGRVFAANFDERDYARRIRRGFSSLEQYGRYSSSAYYMDNPYEPLFQAGGAKELRVQDLLDLGYAQRPPLVPTCGLHVGMGKDHLQHRPSCWANARPVSFPQLEGVDIPPMLECEYCGRDDLATDVALKQHQQVMHTERRQQEGLSAAIIDGLKSGGAMGGQPEAVAAAVVATLQAMGITPQQAQVKAKTRNDDDDDEEAFPLLGKGSAIFPSPAALAREVRTHSRPKTLPKEESN